MKANQSGIDYWLSIAMNIGPNFGYNIMFFVTCIISKDINDICYSVFHGFLLLNVKSKGWESNKGWFTNVFSTKINIVVIDLQFWL